MSTKAEVSERAASEVGCPMCIATPGEECRSIYEPHERLDESHPDRIRKWRKWQQERKAAGLS